jgi:uncharacterized protein (DUF1800 family)
VRIRFFIAAFLVAGSAQAAPIGYEGARHLLNRTGFGATDEEIRDYAKLERAQAVDRILAGTRREAVLKPPAFVDGPFVRFVALQTLNEEERRAEIRRRTDEAFGIREWWLREMLATPSPLTERMTLFWHGHFATSLQKVYSAKLMYQQNALLRSEALGNFGAMLHGVARDPAMLVYLDAARSQRQAPNENFAREVMELFTLGEGRYSERDVKEAARAFTGWGLDREATFVRRRGQHDGGSKTVLGETGRFDGTDVLNILLARPETAEFITAKLWKEFVSPTPDAKEVKRLASVLRDTSYELKPLMRAMLASDAFWSTDNRGTLVKSPVELVVGTLRIFQVHPIDLRPAVVACATLGQNPFAPPNVKGWPGGEAWINSATLLNRKQVVERLLLNDDRMDARAAMSPETGMSAAAPGKGRQEQARRLMERGLANYRVDWDKWSAARSDHVDKLVLAIAPANDVSAEITGADRVRRLAVDPAYQLK